MNRINRFIARFMPENYVERIRIRRRGGKYYFSLRDQIRELKDEIDELRTDHRRLVQLMDTVEQLALDLREAANKNQDNA